MDSFLSGCFGIIQQTSEPSRALLLLSAQPVLQQEPQALLPVSQPVQQALRRASGDWGHLSEGKG